MSCVIVESQTPVGVWRHGPRIRVVTWTGTQRNFFSCRYADYEKQFFFLGRNHAPRAVIVIDGGASEPAVTWVMIPFDVFVRQLSFSMSAVQKCRVIVARR